jgi:hypothetical protein
MGPRSMIMWGCTSDNYMSEWKGTSPLLQGLNNIVVEEYAIVKTPHGSIFYKSVLEILYAMIRAIPKIVSALLLVGVELFEVYGLKI